MSNPNISKRAGAAACILTVGETSFINNCSEPAAADERTGQNDGFVPYDSCHTVTPVIDKPILSLNVVVIRLNSTIKHML